MQRQRLRVRGSPDAYRKKADKVLMRLNFLGGTVNGCQRFGAQEGIR